MIYYVEPMHKQEAFSYLDFNDNDFVVTNMLCDTVLSLPMNPYLSQEKIDKVCRVIELFINKY